MIMSAVPMMCIPKIAYPIIFSVYLYFVIMGFFFYSLKKGDEVRAKKQAQDRKNNKDLIKEIDEKLQSFSKTVSKVSVRKRDNGFYYIYVGRYRIRVAMRSWDVWWYLRMFEQGLTISDLLIRRKRKKAKK